MTLLTVGIVSDHQGAAAFVEARRNEGEVCETTPPAPKRLQTDGTERPAEGAERLIEFVPPQLLAKAAILEGYMPGDIVMTVVDLRTKGCSVCQLALVSFSAFANVLQHARERILLNGRERPWNILVIFVSRPPSAEDLKKIDLVPVKEALASGRATTASVRPVIRRARQEPRAQVFLTNFNARVGMAQQILDWHASNSQGEEHKLSVLHREVLQLARDILAGAPDTASRLDTFESQELRWSY